MRFLKQCLKESISAKMMPVPRELSASCGVCVRLESVCAPSVPEHEDMERCYIMTSNGAYVPLGG
ncbi:MAG: DUF3343 domain-containing protein [Peptococcaceae bacterium]|nr:DUF3343 domain-containing protein [Peptococcaceae bacterium]